MSNITQLPNTSIEAIEQDVRNELIKEASERAKKALKSKMLALQTAKGVVANIEREIQDLKASISDGSFTG